MGRIGDGLRSHPDVLSVRWHVCSAAGRWKEGAEIADAMVTLVPEEEGHWVHRSYALHELKRTGEARDLLLPAARRFPGSGIIRYNLACYECQLGNMTRAKRWLRAAFGPGKSGPGKADALKDPDLLPLQGYIAGL